MIYKDKEKKRMKFIIFPVFVFTLCLSLASTISGEEQIDFYYITLQWPGSKCNTKEGCCYSEISKPAKDFVISEMVPYYFNGTWPKFCNPGSRFNRSKIKDLVPRLRSYWPSLDCPAGKSEKVWSRAWRKYGTCTETFLDQHQYFATALKLKKKANLLKALAAAGIHPNGGSYDIGKISDTIVASGLGLPGLVCNEDNYGNFQLSQIIFCSNYNGASFQECPGNVIGSCNSIVKFPSF